MMGNKPVIAFKGDHEPVQMAKGNNKVTGWRRELLSGTELSFYNTYKDSVSLSIEGRTDVSDEVYREKSGNTVVVPATEHSKPYPDKVIVSGNTVQMSDWYGVNGQSSQYTDTKLGTVNIIDTESLENVEYLGSGSFRASSWAQRILSNNKVLKVFKPSTTYYFKAKYTLETISNLPVYQRTVGFNLHSSATGSLSFGSCATLDMVGESIEVSGTFTTPPTIGDKALLFYSNRYTDGTTVELDTVKVEKFIISEVNAPYEPYKDTVKNGLVLEYNGKNFFNTPQTTLLKDRSGNNNHGIPYGFAYNSTSGSDENGGIVFDGVDDYIDTGYDLGTNHSESTVSCWAYNFGGKGNTYTVGTLFGRSRAGNSNDIIVGFTSLNKLSVYTSEVGGINYTTTSSYLNEWVHITLVYKSSTLVTLYINGNKEIDIPINLPWFTGNLLIGDAQYAYDETFKGKISYVSIYNRALSESEINQNYMAGTSINMPSPEDPSPVVSNLPSGTYKYTSTDGIYEFTLGEELRGIGDVTDKVVFDRVSKLGKISRAFNHIIFNGTETWSTFTGGYYVNVLGSTASNMYRPKGVSSHFKFIESGGYTNPIGRFYFNGLSNGTQSDYWNGNVTFGYDNGAGGFPNFKGWLASQNSTGNPLTLHYQLLKPIISPLTFTKVSSSTAPEVPMQFITSEPSPDYPAEMYDVEEGNVVSISSNLSFEDLNGDGSADGWSISGSNLSCANGVQRIGSLTGSVVTGKSVERILGNKYYYRIMVKTNNSSLNLNNGHTVAKISKIDEWTSISWVQGCTRAGSPHLGMYCTPNAGTYAELKAPTFIDLGSSGSPLYNKTLAELDNIFSSKSTTPLLRKVGTVADTYNPLTGEYVQRVGKYEITGLEGWSADFITSNGFILGAIIPTDKKGLYTPAQELLCTHCQNSRVRYTNSSGITIGFTYAYELFGVDSLEGFKQKMAWFYNNGTPVTIYYQLATPIVTYLEPNLIPLYDVDTYIESDSVIAQPDITVGYELKDGVTTNINDITEPHPDYPRVIDGVGEYDEVNDDYNLEVYSGVGGRNLLPKTKYNINNFLNGYEWTFTSAVATTTPLSFGTNDIVYGEGDYILSFDVKVADPDIKESSVRLSATDDNGVLKTVDYFGRGQFGGEWSRINRTFTLLEPKKLGLQIYNHSFNGVFNSEVSVKNIKIERGTQATPWTPAPEDIQYNTPTNNTFKTLHNFPVELNRVGDIADQYTPPFWGAGYDGDGRNLVTNSLYERVPLITTRTRTLAQDLLMGVDYTCSFDYKFIEGSSTSFALYVYDGANQSINKTYYAPLNGTPIGKTSLTFRITQVMQNPIFVIYGARTAIDAKDTDVEFYNIKLERGSTPTPWTPSSGEFVQRIGKKVFDGSEAWVDRTSETSIKNVKWFQTIIPNTAIKLGYGICSHLDTLTSKSEDFEHYRFINYNGDFLIGVFISNKMMSTLAQFIDYLEMQKLNGKPFTIYYVLDTPILSTITGSAIPTFFPSTKVEVLTNGTKPKLQGTARVVDLLETDF